MENNIEFVNHNKIKHVRFIVNKILFCNSHVHNDFEIAMLLEGKGITTINSAHYKTEKGDIVFINSGEQHSYQALSEDNYINKEEFVKNTPLFLILQISNHFLREYFPEIRNTMFESSDVKKYIPKDQQKLAIKYLLNLAKTYFEAKPFFEFELISKLANLFKEIYSRIPYKIISSEEKDRLKAKSDRIQRIMSYIDENFASQIRLEDIANIENITSTHASHIFKDSFGITFQEYVNMKRLEQSILLMNNTDKTLIDIAYESGFSDPKYMNKIYKKYFNCTPKVFKDEAQKSKNFLEINQDKKEELWFDEEASLKTINKFLDELN